VHFLLPKQKLQTQESTGGHAQEADKNERETVERHYIMFHTLISSFFLHNWHFYGLEFCVPLTCHVFLWQLYLSEALCKDILLQMALKFLEHTTPNTFGT
jgi:hypothetical protein